MNKQAQAYVPAKTRVEVVDTLEAFERLRNDWDLLYDTDMESTVFLSWSWLFNAFRSSPMRWSVLVLRDQASQKMLAALPLKYRVHWSRSRKEFQTEIEAGGRLLWSEYTGFLCVPNFEEMAMQRFASKLSEMPWSKLSMRYVLQQRRAHLFVEAFDTSKFSAKFKTYRISKGKTDNLKSPQVELPDTFDDYLMKQISANTRQKYNRGRRDFLETGRYTLSVTTPTSFKDDVDQMLGHWVRKWEPEKGKNTALQVAENYRTILQSALENRILYLPVLRRNEQIIGALGHIMDTKNGVLHYVVAGRDIAEESSFVGPALHFESIRWAIEQGFICYDFCHGDESFKYSYGATDADSLYFQIRRSSPAGAEVFDSICSAEALRRIGTFIGRKKYEDSQKAIEQLASTLS